MMETEVEGDIIDLTGASDDDEDGTVPIPIDLTLGGRKAADRDVKLEPGEDPGDVGPSGNRKRRNLPRKGRPEAGSLNLLQLERRVNEGKAPDHNRKRLKTQNNTRMDKEDEGEAELDSNLGSMQNYGAAVEAEERPSQAKLDARAALRQSHKVRFFGACKPSEKKDGWTQHDGLEFWIDDELPETLIRLSKGSMVLANLNTSNGLGVVQVLEVLEDIHGEAGLAVRYGWIPSDMVALGMLDFPAVTVEFPRQVFWQKDACEDGVRHVSGSHQGKAWNDILSWTHMGAPCMVKHRSELTPEELEACRQPLPENEMAASLDPEHPELFFYSMQFDHTVKRFETVWLECDADIMQPTKRCQGPLSTMDAFCGAGNVSKAAQLLTKAAAKEASAGLHRSAPTEKRGFDVRWGIEAEGDIFSAYLENISGEDCHLDLHHAVSLETFVEGKCQVYSLAYRVKKYQETGEMPAWGTPPMRDSVDLIHCSPPCQSLSKLNSHSDESRVEEKLFPILDQLVELVRLIRPTFFTLEEVTTFLLHWLSVSAKDRSTGTRAVRCVWRVVLPLLDMGYQVDVRILNAVHYAVPQLRKRVIMFAAKPDYELPFPPTPWTHYDRDPPGAEEPDDSSDAPPSKKARRNGSLVENCRDAALLNTPDPRWASVAVDSAAAHAGPAGPLPGAVTSRDALEDLPFCVNPGQGMQTFQYDRAWIRKQSDYVKFLRTDEDNRMGHLHSNWLSKAEKNTIKCLEKLDKRADYDQPYPTIFGSVSHHAEHQLCPRPNAERLCSVAEKKRLQCFMDGMRLAGPVSKQMLQVGNAVPILLAWAVFGAVFKAAYGVEAPIPDFVRQRQMAAGKRAAEAVAEEPSMETHTMKGLEHGVPSRESDFVPANEAAGPSGSHVAASAPLQPPTPEQPPSQPSRRPASAAEPVAPARPPAAGAARRSGDDLANGNAAADGPAAECAARGGGSVANGNATAVGAAATLRKLVRARTLSESPTAAAAEALRELAAEAAQAPAPAACHTPKQQRVGYKAAGDGDIPQNVLRLMGTPGGRGGSPGRHRAVRQTMEFYSPSEGPCLPPTSAKGTPAAGQRVGHGRRSGSPANRSPCPRPGLRSLPAVDAPPASIGSATGKNNNANASAAAAAPAHPDEPVHARTTVQDTAAAGEGVLRNGCALLHPPGAKGGSAAGGAKIGRPSPARQQPGAAFPFAMVPSRSASPACAARLNVPPSSGQSNRADTAPDSSQETGLGLLESAALPGTSLGELPASAFEEQPGQLAVAASELVPDSRDEAEEDVDILGWGQQPPTPFQQTSVAMKKAVAARGEASEGLNGAELADELANGTAHELAEAICDLTSDDMRTFEDGAATSVADQAALEAPEQETPQMPEQDAAGAPDQDVQETPKKDALKESDQAATVTSDQDAPVLAAPGPPPPTQPEQLPQPPASEHSAPFPPDKAAGHPTAHPLPRPLSALEGSAGEDAAQCNRSITVSRVLPAKPAVPVTPAAPVKLGTAACEAASSGAQPSQLTPPCAAAAHCSAGCSVPGFRGWGEATSAADSISARPGSMADAAAASATGGAAAPGAAAKCGDAGQESLEFENGDASSEADIEIDLSLDGL